MKMFRHEGLAEFGLAKMKQNITGIQLLRQMLLGNLLKKDIEEYGVLKITKKGQEFLKKPRSFKIVLNNHLKKRMRR